MISKNSFLVNMKENNKRRIWIWIVSSLFWFFYYPAAMAMLMSRRKGYNLIEMLGAEESKARLIETAGDWLSIQAGVSVFVSIAAIICAIQGFSYLYSRKKVDLYHSVPVKKSRRFAVIFTNGILIYFVPYFINLLLAIGIAGINGGMNGTNFKVAMIGLCMNLVLYIGTYSLTVIAVMMTGNIIITFFATVIFLLYEVAVRALFYECESMFYDYFSYSSQNAIPLFSPMSHYWQMAGCFTLADMKLQIAGNAWIMPGIKGVLLAVMFTAIAYFCYSKRPAEAAGKTMAFARTKSVIKFLLTVPVSIAVTLIVKDIIGSEGSDVLVGFGMAVAIILSNCVIEVIYELDIKAAFHKKYQILISGVCAVGIYCIFLFDLTGFDSWVPKADQLEDAVVIIPYDYSYGNSYLDVEMNGIGMVSYYLSRPGIKDTEAICELSEKKGDIPDDGDAVYLRVAYRMKGGRVKWREFSVSGKEEELLNRILGSREYKENVNQICDDELYQSMKSHGISNLTFDSGFKEENLSTEDMDTIRELYIKDLEKMNYSTLRNEYTCGNIKFRVQIDKNRSMSFAYDVYPSYENTIAFLKDRGVYNESYLEPEAVASITVTNYHREMMTEEDYSYEARFDHEDYSVSKVFTDEKQIEELAGALYPCNFNRNWKKPEEISDDYYVTIQYKNGSVDTAYYRGDNSAYLITDRIPSWLERETAYK